MATTEIQALTAPQSNFVTDWQKKHHSNVSQYPTKQEFRQTLQAGGAWELIQHRGAGGNYQALWTNTSLTDIVQGIEPFVPVTFTDAPFKRVVENIIEKTNLEPALQLLQGKRLTIEQMEVVRTAISEKLQAGEQNKAVEKLCMRVLKNPYDLGEQTFCNWLELLGNNFGKNYFSNLSLIFSAIDAETQNLKEKFLHAFVDMSGSGQAQNQTKQKKLREKVAARIKQLPAEMLEQARKSARKQYYQMGLTATFACVEKIPEGMDITDSLRALNKFFEILSKSGIADINGQIEDCLLQIMKKVRLTETGTSMDENTLSNIFDTCIQFPQKPEVKEQFIEKLFLLIERYPNLVVNKATDILKAPAYQTHTKLFVVQKLSENYGLQHESLPNSTSIEEAVRTFIQSLISDAEREKAFTHFAKILSPAAKAGQYQHLMNPNFFILPLYREVLEEQHFGAGLKRNAIVQLCAAYTDGTKQEDITTLIEEFVTNTANPLSLREKACTDFYENTLKKDAGKQKFRAAVEKKCERLTDLPQRLRNDIFADKAPDEKRRIQEAVFAQYSEAQTTGNDASALQDDMIAWILNAGEDNAQRTLFLKTVFEATKKPGKSE